MIVSGRELLEADMFIRLLDANSLSVLALIGTRVALVRDLEAKPSRSGKVKLYRYRYDPESDFRAPLIVASPKNYRDALAYVRKHPNRVLAVIADLNGFTMDPKAHGDFIKLLRETYRIPLLYASGARSAMDLAPPPVLRRALTLYFEENGFERKKMYRGLFESLPALLEDGRFFEEV
ncbi:MAG: hypothetical protein ACP5LW_03315 [Nitrososphaeria archaeon]